MKIKINSFLGEFPRIYKSKLKPEAATIAVDVDTSSGSLKTLYAINAAITLNINGVQTKDVHLWRIADVDYWLQFKSFVNIIRSPIADDAYKRIYWSGDTRDTNGNVLYSYTPNIYQGGIIYPVTWYKLGIPAPTAAPTVSSFTNSLPEEEKAQYADEQRIYVYTYVTETGEESAPSPASPPIIAPHKGSTVTLDSILLDGATGTGRAIVNKRIYRSLSNSSGQAELYFLAQIPAAQNTYIDTVLGSDLNTLDPIATIGWTEPRLFMKGLGLTAYGVAYGFIDKTICLSEAWHPYAWPREYELTAQYEVVAMGQYESYIVVATKGSPIIVSGIDPQSMNVLELPLNESCVAARSLVSMAHSVIYASPNGLVMASGSTARLVTEPYFSKDEWSALNPASIHAVEHRGNYLFFYDAGGTNKGAYLFNPLQIEHGIVALDLWAASTHRDQETDTLYLLQTAGVVQKFDDTSLTRKPYRWRSRLFELGGTGTRLLAARVMADSYNSTTIKVFADGAQLYARLVTNNKPFRMPNHSKKIDWQIEVSGTDIVRNFEIAETMQELVND